MAAETAQELDPLGGITGRIFVIAVGLVALALAVTLTLLNAGEISSPALVGVGILLLAAGFGYLVWAADPYRRRVTRARYGVAYVLVLLASVFESAAQLGTDADVRNDWGPIAVALILMVSGPYRTPIEITVRTAVAAVLVAGTTVLQIETLREQNVIISLVISGVLVVGLGGGAAIFAFSLTTGLKLDRRRASEARDKRDARERRGAIEQFLGDDIETLRREVLPFLREVKTRDVLTEDDRERAQSLSRTLRASLALSAASEPLEEIVALFSDPDALAMRLGDAQRTALRTLVAHLAEQPGLERHTLSLEFRRGGGTTPERMTGTVGVSFSADRGSGLGLAPFVGLMQLAFRRVDVQSSVRSVVISFGI